MKGVADNENVCATEHFGHISSQNNQLYTMILLLTYFNNKRFGISKCMTL